MKSPVFSELLARVLGKQIPGYLDLLLILLFLFLFDSPYRQEENQTAKQVAKTVATITHHPKPSTIVLPAAESDPPLAVVPLGNVPLIRIVDVPLTSATLTSDLFNAA